MPPLPLRSDSSWIPAGSLDCRQRFPIRFCNPRAIRSGNTDERRPTENVPVLRRRFRRWEADYTSKGNGGVRLAGRLQMPPKFRDADWRSRITRSKRACSFVAWRRKIVAARRPCSWRAGPNSNRCSLARLKRVLIP